MPLEGSGWRTARQPPQQTERWWKLVFPTKTAQRLVSLPLRARSSIKRRLNTDDNQESAPSDKILAEFEASVVELNQAVAKYCLAKSDLDRSCNDRQGVRASCEELVNRAIAGLESSQPEGSSDETSSPDED